MNTKISSLMPKNHEKHTTLTLSVTTSFYYVKFSFLMHIIKSEEIIRSGKKIE